MALVSEVISGALRLCRIRDVPTAQTTEAIEVLNLLLKSWDEHLQTPVTSSFTLTASTASYTIGSGGDLNTTRPMSIKSAYIRNSDGTDYPLNVRLSPIDYDRITDKDYDSRAENLYYDADYSSGLGKVYLDAAYSTAETLYLTMYQSHTVYSATTDTIVLPPEYEKALRYGLAVDLAAEYGIQLPTTVIQQAVYELEKIERRNMRITEAEFDDAMLR